MTVRTRIAAVLVLVAMLMLVTAASCTKADSVVGTWVADRDASVLVLTKYSTFSGGFSSTIMAGSTGGGFMFIDNGAGIEFLGDGQSLKVPYTLSGDTLELYVNSETWKFTRSAD